LTSFAAQIKTSEQTTYKQAHSSHKRNYREERGCSAKPRQQKDSDDQNDHRYPELQIGQNRFEQEITSEILRQPAEPQATLSAGSTLPEGSMRNDG
jgi:hypothetical protein